MGGGQLLLLAFQGVAGVLGLLAGGFGLLAGCVQGVGLLLQSLQDLVVFGGHLLQGVYQCQQLVEIARLHQKTDAPAAVQLLHGAHLLFAAHIGGVVSLLGFFQRAGRGVGSCLLFQQLAVGFLQSGIDGVQLFGQVGGLAFQLADLALGLLLCALQRFQVALGILVGLLGLLLAVGQFLLAAVVCPHRQAAQYAKHQRRGPKPLVSLHTRPLLYGQKKTVYCNRL